MFNRNQKYFMDEYANWHGLRSVCITVDTDWAPDYMIGVVKDLVESFNVKVTFFSTNESKLMKQIYLEERHEVGIHPNIMPGSTQGSSAPEIVGNLKKLYPSAKSSRFHVLNMSYRDLHLLSQNNIKYDVSRIMFNTPYILPAWHKDIDIVLLTYIWEDGVCENQSIIPSLRSMDLESPGVKILNFHPINVYINSKTRKSRLEFQNDNRNLLCTEEGVAEKYYEDGAGARTALMDLCEFVSISGVKTLTIGELAGAFPREIYGTKQ